MGSLWESAPERILPGHGGSSNVVYDESGTIYCYLCPGQCQTARFFDGEQFSIAPVSLARLAAAA
jgi:hypothetical protein